MQPSGGLNTTVEFIKQLLRIIPINSPWKAGALHRTHTYCVGHACYIAAISGNDAETVRMRWEYRSGCGWEGATRVGLGPWGVEDGPLRTLYARLYCSPEEALALCYL